MEHTTIRIERCLVRLKAGDAAARDELIKHSCERLRRLAARWFSTHSGLQRWVDSDDLLQNAILRLTWALGDLVPDSSRRYFGLASLQIRRELIDMSRHYRARRGPGVNETSLGESGDRQVHQAVTESCDRRSRNCSLYRAGR